MGPLGRRFVLAFALVSVLTVALVAAAGLVGSQRGLSSADDVRRQAVALRAAAALASAYEEAGGWLGADLQRAEAVARGGGGELTLRSRTGRVLWSADGRGAARLDGRRDGRGMDLMPGPRGQLGEDVPTARAPVVVDGTRVGLAEVAFVGPPGREGRPVAWAWILVAALAALGAALAAGWLVVRQLTRPVTALTDAARSFASGDRDTVVRERGVGELGELADAFDQAVGAVRRAESARSQMAADVAHELRTPLAALQAGLEELRDGHAPADAAALARLHDQALRVGRVVGDLDALFAAEGAAREVERMPVDLSEVVRDEVEARSAQLRASGLEVHVGAADPVVVLGDRERLHQVLGNLLQNCARHCRPGDSVTVTCRNGDDGAARLIVADDGPGIEPADLPHVLDRFWRGRPARESVPGSGLGLAVVRGIAAAHQGDVAVESDGRSGTTVTVTLPLAPVLTDPAGVRT